MASFDEIERAASNSNVAVVKSLPDISWRVDVRERDGSRPPSLLLMLEGENRREEIRSRLVAALKAGSYDFDTIEVYVMDGVVVRAVQQHEQAYLVEIGPSTGRLWARWETV